jgi:serine/threonine protein kinase
MMLTTNGSIKVMDFGIARVLGTSRMTRQGNIVGTIEYMSPEAIQGMDVDARSDIYSLGLLLYEMLTGRLPFVSDSEFQMMMAQIQQAPPPPRTFAPHIPVVIEQAIMRSLAKKPEARFQDVMDFRRVVEGGVQGAPTQPAQRPPAIAPTRMGAGPASPPLSTGPALPQPPGQTAMPPAPGYQPNSPWQPQPATPPQGYGPPAFQPQTATPPQGMAPPQYPNYSQPQFGQQPSFMSRLNWKHYTAGAAALFLLILAPFVIMAFMKGPEPPPQKNTPLVSPQPDPVTENKPSVNKEPDTQPYTGGEKIEETTSIPPDSSEDPNAGKTKPSKPARKDDAAARERARKRAEAKRLLDQ